MAVPWSVWDAYFKYAQAEIDWTDDRGCSHGSQAWTIGSFLKVAEAQQREDDVERTNTHLQCPEGGHPNDDGSVLVLGQMTLLQSYFRDF